MLASDSKKNSKKVVFHLQKQSNVFNETEYAPDELADKLAI